MSTSTTAATAAAYIVGAALFLFFAVSTVLSSRRLARERNSPQEKARRESYERKQRLEFVLLALSAPRGIERPTDLLIREAEAIIAAEFIPRPPGPGAQGPW